MSVCAFRNEIPAVVLDVSDRLINGPTPHLLRGKRLKELAPVFALQRAQVIAWSRQRDLNPRPSDYKSDALPTELCRHT
jgi:hypothetical protein